MKIKILEKEETKIKFMLEGANNAFANTLRRIMTSEVPTMAECKCKGKGCSQCEVVLVLDKQGPCMVKAGDMKSSADDVEPWDKEIPIAELLEGQELKFEATAQLG